MPLRMCVQAMAEHYQHIIVAPDSEFATTRGWVIPNANQAPSLDMLHTLVSSVVTRQVDLALWLPSSRRSSAQRLKRWPDS